MWARPTSTGSSPPSRNQAPGFKVGYLVSFAVLFPGQGSQFVGMGSDLFEARPDLLGDAADEALGWSLRSMCLDGPEDELTLTQHAQPALFALGYALWDEVRRAIPQLPSGAAGHSLGEYTALTAAGVLDFHTALSVVAERGRAMAAAADAEASGMAAVLGADLEKVEEITESRRSDGGRLYVANVNAPGQVVVAGASGDIDWLMAEARILGVRRVVELKVAGAFHTEFMEPAADRVAAALSGIAMEEPVFPVWSNTTAAPHRSGSIEETLSAQVVSPVRFSESLEQMAGTGVEIFMHVGPGDVTAGMAKRTVKGSETIAISNIDDIAAAADLIVTMDRSGEADEER